MAGMKLLPRSALWFGAIAAAVVALWAALAILNMWFLVPLDPALTSNQAVRTKLEYMALFALVFLLFGGLSGMALQKIRTKR
jgi:hypothetical protein